MSEPRTDLLEPYEGFGKYEGELNLCEVLDGLDEDESVGDLEDHDYYYRLYRFDAEFYEQIGPVGDYVGAVLTVSGRGFVSGNYYSTVEAMEAAWTDVVESIEQELAERMEDEDEDEAESE